MSTTFPPLPAVHDLPTTGWGTKLLAALTFIYAWIANSGSGGTAYATVRIVGSNVIAVRSADGSTIATGSVTDAGPVINAAVADAMANGGGKIALGCGVFLIVTTVLLDTGVHLSGNGRIYQRNGQHANAGFGSVLKAGSGLASGRGVVEGGALVGSPAVMTNTAPGVVVSDIVVFGNGVAGTHGIVGLNATDFDLSRAAVFQCPGYGVWITGDTANNNGGVGATLASLQIQTCGTGIYTSGLGSTDQKITDVKITSCSNGGINLTQGGAVIDVFHLTGNGPFNISTAGITSIGVGYVDNVNAGGIGVICNSRTIMVGTQFQMNTNAAEFVQTSGKDTIIITCYNSGGFATPGVKWAGSGAPPSGIYIVVNTPGPAMVDGSGAVIANVLGNASQASVICNAF